MKRSIRYLTVFVFSLLTLRSAAAHFPWLTINDQQQAILFFGETPEDRVYKLPDSIKKTQVHLVGKDGQSEPIELMPVESEQLVAMQSKGSLSETSWLSANVTYGIYHGSRLDYYAQHLGGPLPTDRQAYQKLGQTLALQAQLIDTTSGIDVFVLWKGEPLANAEVRLFCEQGHEEGSATTDANGKVSFDDKQVETGLNGILVGHKSNEQAGQIGEQTYDSISHYLTVTFIDPEDFAIANSPETPSTKAAQTEQAISVSSDDYPPIPETVTSFGAAITAKALYLYGGHKGRAHEYDAEAQGKTLWRLDLQNPKSWESLGEGPGLQGLAMVAHNEKLYRLGGFVAKNQEGEEQDLWSQADASCYDPSTQKWNQLPPLPEPRSSFDAAVLSDAIYVIGGWDLQGDREPHWHSTAHVLDLSSRPLQWQPLPEPPFQRRALSVAAHEGKVYAIGGMQHVGGPTTRVDVYDPKSRTWSRGPDLVGEGMDGFGSASFAVGGELYVTTYSGTLQRLDREGKAWEVVGRLERDRFFHRLLPLSDDQLIAIGGASMSSGKFEQIDVIRVQSH